jgi:predicted dehydrogenase
MKPLSRRNFLATTSAGLTGVALTNPINSVFAQSENLSRKITRKDRKVRVALVGTGSRGTATWGANLIHPYSDYVEMVGLCDANRARLKVGKELIRTDAPVYHSSEFDKMIQQTNPDLVIVTTTDCFHADYVVRAMELGCDTLSEKPLATEAEQCQRILDAEAKTGKTVWVGFNARHGQDAMQAKKILNSNELGKIISVEFHEYLDINHGASYYRRWHGRKEYSGSLLVHKASHHFDQINWWMNAEPVEVTAYGKVAFYGSNNPFRGEKCRGCQFKEQCDFYWDITKSDRYMKLYVDCEHEDGYIRDDCVWDHDITSYDTQTVQVLYDNGAILNYSLNSYMPYEGQQIAFNGTKGRLDIRNYHNQPWDVPYESEFRITKSFKGTETIKVGGKEGIRVASGNEGQENFRAQGERGGHGGADPHLKDLLFIPETPDPLNQIAGSHAGVASSLIGIAAVKSIESGGNPVKIADLIDYPKSWNWWGARR